MADAGNGSVQLLEADPELARGLDPRRVREVSQRLFARAIDVPRGTWSPGRALSGGSQPIGLLVLEGLLVREAIVGDHPSAELLGPGDLLRAWDDRDAEVLLPRTVEWSALSAVRLAVIDQALAVRAAQWPEIFASLVERAARRAERLVVMQAIAHLTRVDAQSRHCELNFDVTETLYDGTEDDGFGLAMRRAGGYVYVDAWLQ